jgi:hypothetical protein
MASSASKEVIPLVALPLIESTCGGPMLIGLYQRGVQIMGVISARCVWGEVGGHAAGGLAID